MFTDEENRYKKDISRTKMGAWREFINLIYCEWVSPNIGFIDIKYFIESK